MSHGPAEPDGIVVRPAERADLLSVVRIERTSFPQPWPYEACVGFLGEPGFLVAVDARDESVQADPVGADGGGATAARRVEAGPIVGYVVADVTATHGGDVGHVKDVAVAPERRGEGIGASLLSNALATMAAANADSVTLEVRASNEGAQRLYRRFGFEPLRRVRDYYADGEDALVLLRGLGRE